MVICDYGSVCRQLAAAKQRSTIRVKQPYWISLMEKLGQRANRINRLNYGEVMLSDLLNCLRKKDNL